MTDLGWPIHFTNWLRKCAFHGHASAKPLMETRNAKAEMSRPLRKGFGFTVECYKSVQTGIVALLKSCCPAAVFWTIIAIAINAIYSEIKSIGRQHIVSEIQVVSPQIADLDSTATVIRKRFAGGIRAAFNHPSPYFVKTGFAVSVDSMDFSHSLLFKAPATSGFFKQQIASPYSFLHSAVALAMPCDRMPEFNVASLNYHPSPEALARQIFEFHI